jgi:hypothetical protein
MPRLYGAWLALQVLRRVTQDRLDIRGYIDTARKHGLGAYEVLHQLMTGNPWLPPAPPISP